METFNVIKPTFHILSIQAPKSSTVQFESLFGSVSKPSFDALKAISDSREFILTSREKKLYKQAISETANYVAYLYGLVRIMSQSMNEINVDQVELLKKDIEKKTFYSYWNSTLSSDYNPKSLYVYDVNWEILFTLFNLALDHRSIATTIVSLDYSNLDISFAEASKHLRIAAGIFDFISENVVSNYFVDTNVVHFPEVFSETYKFLSNLCHAEIHELAAAKTIKSVKDLKTTGILCSTASHYYQICYNSINDLSKLLAKKNCINNSTVTYVQWKISYYKALAHMYISMDFYEKMQPGVSVRHIDTALTLINSIELIKSNDKNLVNLSTQIKEFKHIIESMHKEYNDNNNKIYRDYKTDVDVKIDIRSIVKPVQYEKPANKSIEISPSDSGQCVIQ